jgi:uncharacterized surface protein with fasciclin (FAS1) repeats
MRLIARSTLLVVLAALPPFVSTGVAADDRSAFTKAIASSRIYGFMEILRNSGLAEESVNGADVTLIIPIDTSFYTLTPERYTALLAPANKELAARYIRAHVVSGRLTIAQLAAGGHKTLGGVEIKVAPGAKTEAAKVNGCRVVLADQSGSTGMFHLIDGFLFQP